MPPGILAKCWSSNVRWLIWNLVMIPLNTKCRCGHTPCLRQILKHPVLVWRILRDWLTYVPQFDNAIAFKSEDMNDHETEDPLYWRLRVRRNPIRIRRGAARYVPVPLPRLPARVWRGRCVRLARAEGILPVHKRHAPLSFHAKPDGVSTQAWLLSRVWLASHWRRKRRRIFPVCRSQCGEPR